MADEIPYSVADCWIGPWNEGEFKKWALKLRRSILPHEVDLGLVFLSPNFADHAGRVVDIARNAVGAPALAGCVANGLISNQWEFEQQGGIVLGLYHLPGSRLTNFRFTADMAQEAINDSAGGYWRRQLDLEAEGINGWLVFEEPLQVNVEEWLRSWSADFPGVPVYGGLAHFDRSSMSSLVICDDALLDGGGVAVGFGGGIRLSGLTAQGCTPVGDPWTVTKAKGNLLERLGNRPATQILEDTIRSLSDEMKQRSRGNVFIGLAVDEYLDEFTRGDFLVRNLLAIDEPKGSIAVGAYPRVGQSAQFQIRDGEGASQELDELVAQCEGSLRGKRIFGGCVSDCAGRGSGLFGSLHHDSKRVHKLVHPQSMVGFFGNGEFGPVGGKNFVHGYTASAALFTEL